MKIIELRCLSKAYHRKEVLTEVSYDFRKSELVLLVGENGSGKSTLIKGIIGLVRFNAGEVLLHTDLIAYVPERFAFPAYLTILDFLRTICPNYSKEAISALLEEWELEPYKNYLLKNLSKGMAQKVLIMQALLTQAELYLFDEPLNGLDQWMQELFIQTLLALKKEKATIIIATHYPECFLPCADRILTLKNGGLYDTPASLSF